MDRYEYEEQSLNNALNRIKDLSNQFDDWMDWEEVSTAKGNKIFISDDELKQLEEEDNYIHEKYNY